MHHASDATTISTHLIHELKKALHIFAEPVHLLSDNVEAFGENFEGYLSFWLVRNTPPSTLMNERDYHELQRSVKDHLTNLRLYDTMYLLHCRFYSRP
jgi:hypothetical protein